MKNIAVLGCTGSIGRQTLDIIRANPDKFRAAVLCAGRDADAMLKAAEEFRPDYIAMADEAAADKLRQSGIKAKIAGGEQAVLEAAAQLEKDIRYLAKAAGLKPGATMVLGCSTSEVAGGRIGKNSVPELGDALAETMIGVCGELGLCPVFQCCEHLNRALVVERDVAEAHGFEIVNAIPQLHAGGSFAMTAWANFKDPVLVETIVADAGLDIGGTLIGMHLRRVAIPVRLSIKKIGEANILCARTRPKYIGGARAVYQDL